MCSKTPVDIHLHISRYSNALSNLALGLLSQVKNMSVEVHLRRWEQFAQFYHYM